MRNCQKKTGRPKPLDALGRQSRQRASPQPCLTKKGPLPTVE